MSFCPKLRAAQWVELKGKEYRNIAQGSLAMAPSLGLYF